MFEFFVALFGGAYYTNKLFGEKARTDRYKSNFEARRNYHLQRLFRWIEQVCDRKLEEDLEFFVSDPQNYDMVWKAVHNAYLQMPTYQSYTTILLYEPMVLQHYGRNTYTKKQRESIAEHERSRALDIMLANHGKVRHCYTSSGAKVDTLNMGDGEHSRKVWDEIFEHWVYIRDELRRNGVDARLIFKMGLCGEEHRQIAYDADDVEKFHYQAGELTWLPLTYYDDNLQYMRA